MIDGVESIEEKILRLEKENKALTKDLTYLANILGQATLTEASIFIVNTILDKYRGKL